MPNFPVCHGKWETIDRGEHCILLVISSNLVVCMYVMVLIPLD